MTATSSPSTTEHKRPNYVMIWLYLFVLTVAEVALAFELPLSRNVKLLLLLFLAVWKALLVALFFMHLKFERWRLRLIFIVPLPLAAILVTTVIMEKSGSAPRADQAAHHAAGAVDRRGGFLFGRARSRQPAAAREHADRDCPRCGRDQRVESDSRARRRCPHGPHAAPAAAVGAPEPARGDLVCFGDHGGRRHLLGRDGQSAHGRARGAHVRELRAALHAAEAKNVAQHPGRRRAGRVADRGRLDRGRR